MKKHLLVLAACCLSSILGAPSLSAQEFPFKRKWVDSIYKTLSREERIGQLFMVAAYSAGDKANAAKIEQLLKARQIGGVIFMQGTPEAQAKLTNKWQRSAGVPLLIGMDAEWGLGMRLTGVKNMPRQMMIGATQDTALMYEMGAAVAAQCRRLGVHVDFAPVVDVNNNPRNPVINFRSFGDDKEWVSRLGIAYMKGLQQNGVMACAKHFPGHGDVAVDSHLDLPVISKSKAQLQELELYPFRQLIAAGIKSVMIAHLSVPAIDDTKNMPATLSRKAITGLLREEMGFGGLIFTDALDMKGVAKYYPDGEADLKALMAGNDVLLFSQNVPLAISKIDWALQTGKIQEAELEAHVKRILAAKYEAGLFRVMPVKESHVTEDLNSATDAIREKIARAAVTRVRDGNGIIPKIKAGKGKYAYINVNGSGKNHLQTVMQQRFAGLATAQLPAKSTAAAAKQLAEKFRDYEAIVVGVHDLALYPGKNGAYGLDAAQIFLLQQLSRKKNVIFALMGNAYLMQQCCTAGSVVVGYEDDLHSQEAVWEVISGQLAPKGKLPVKPCR